jgi:hypothetical protein
MVLIRLLAEMTVLILLISLPAFTLAFPGFQKLPLAPKLAVYVVALLALGMLPFYGFVSWRVRIEERGLTAVSLFKRRFAPWHELEKLRFKATLGWRRYVLSFTGGELTFPVWFAELKELVQLIKEHLPQGVQASYAQSKRLYKQDLFGLVLQFGRVVVGFLFISVFWLFFATVGSGKALSPADYGLVLFGCIVATVYIGWRSWVIALMPRSLELTDTELIVNTCFFERRLKWEQVKTVGPSFFMLPEGLMLKTTGGQFLLTEELDSVDELEEALRGKLAARL